MRSTHTEVTLSHWTEHARQRCAQRRIRPEHIKLAHDWGRAIRQRDGRTAYHLGRREAAAAAREGVYIPERALGVTVVLDETWDVVVTAVRSPDRARLRAKGRKPRDRRGSK